MTVNIGDLFATCTHLLGFTYLSTIGACIATIGGWGNIRAGWTWFHLAGLIKLVTSWSL